MQAGGLQPVRPRWDFCPVTRHSALFCMAGLLCAVGRRQEAWGGLHFSAESPWPGLQGKSRRENPPPHDGSSLCLAPRDPEMSTVICAPSRPRGKQAETQIVPGSERGRGRRWKALSAGFRWSPPTICRVSAGARSPGTSGRQGHCVGITHSGREVTGWGPCQNSIPFC